MFLFFLARTLTEVIEYGMTRRTLLLYEECGTIPLTSHPRGLDATHQISHPKEEVVMTHQIFHLRDKELRTKTDGMIPHHLPLQERATKAHPLELNGHMIKVCKYIHKSETLHIKLYSIYTELCNSKMMLFQSLHTEKRQKLLLQMIFRHLGVEYEQAKAQTLISPHRADVLINDGAAQIQICLHLEREVRVEEVQIQISLLQGKGHRGDVGRTQTCLHHGGRALLMDKQ